MVANRSFLTTMATVVITSLRSTSTIRSTAALTFPRHHGRTKTLPSLSSRVSHWQQQQHHRPRSLNVYMSTSSSDTVESVLQNGISRLSTLQTLLSKRGAPGSDTCSSCDDLIPVDCGLRQTGELLDLHPHLIPIAKSRSSGNYVCALRRVAAEDDTVDGPMPIVEGGVCSPGIKLLSLNSEHLMRRIAAEADASGDGDDIIAIYNEGISDAEHGLDAPYEAGSVEKLGYGVEKYTLLRIGPFPDLYQIMALEHASKNDESSSLVAAETANRKFPGFASTFAFYADLLSRTPNRDEEARDAARMCLRLKLPTIGLSRGDFTKVATLAGLLTEEDNDNNSDDELAMAKLQIMYEKIRKHELEQDDTTGKSAEDLAMEEAKYLIDTTALTGGKWSQIRRELADIYEKVGKNTMAKLVDPSRS